MDRDKTRGLPGGGVECMLPPDFIMNDEARAVWNEIEHSDASLFVTGRAGTGKSTLLNYFRRHTAKKHVVLAPTGLAALHVGGATIHSFFGFPLRPMMINDPDIKRWEKDTRNSNLCGPSIPWSSTRCPWFVRTSLTRWMSPFV